MKKLFYAFFLLAFAGSVHAQISAGPGLAYGLDVEELGVQARGVYSITDTWRAEADFVFYLDGEDNVSFWELNLNGNYVFVNNGNSIVYALAGLNFFHAEIDLGPFGDAGATETGLNLGVGGEIGLSDSIKGFGEVKYAISDADQLLIAAGVLFGF